MPVCGSLVDNFFKVKSYLLILLLAGFFKCITKLDVECGSQCLGDATTTICHRHTPPDMLRMLTRSADILVTATGTPGLVTADMVKEGAVVIDVGITRIVDSKTGKYRLVGDVDFEGILLS